MIKLDERAIGVIEQANQDCSELFALLWKSHAQAKHAHATSSDNGRHVIARNAKQDG